MNFYLQPQMDGTMKLITVPGHVEAAAFGPSGSYYSLLNAFMNFTPRMDRSPIRLSSQDAVLECIDAVTRLVGRKLNVYSCADAWFNDQWGIRLGTSETMTVITFLYGGNSGELESALKGEGYFVNVPDLDVQEWVHEILGTIDPDEWAPEE